MRFAAKTFVVMLAAAALVPSASAEDTREDKSTAQLQALSDEEAIEQAKDDLASLLEDFSGYRVGSRLALGDVWFWTRPRASQAWGVCEKDIVSLYYQLTESDPDNYRTAPVRPHKIESRRMYSFIAGTDLKSLRRDFGDEERPAPTTSPECVEQTEQGWSGWFYAESEHSAVHGYTALVVAKQAFDMGLVELTDCEDTGATNTRCEQVFQHAVNPRLLSKIERQQPDNGAEKWRIDSGGAWITVEFKALKRDQQPEDVKSISVQEYIIVT